MSVKLLSEHRCFGGVQQFREHDSRETGTAMRYGLYLPPEPKALLVYLAGLTCNEETFAIKAGAQTLAASLGLAILTPDTSPRGTAIPGQADSWDFGVAAGFYLDATEAPWSTNWRMESYLLQELIPAVQAELSLDRVGLMGHSMGGHGALTLALRHPGRFRSLSAIAPICAPVYCPWGRKAFTGYLGSDESRWADHDASRLMAAQTAAPYPAGIRIDQGLADKFLVEQLLPQQLEAACAAVQQPLALHRHEGYDHGYYFISTVMASQLRHHAERLL
jgi:S-formylglutathione hydrolase